MERGFVAGNQWVALEIGGFEVLQPIGNEGADAVDAELLVEARIFLEICVGEFEKCGGGAETVFLEMNECAGELNKAFIKGIVRAGALGEPEFLKDVVRLEIEPAIEAFEIAEVMGIKIAPFELLD